MKRYKFILINRISDRVGDSDVTDPIFIMSAILGVEMKSVVKLYIRKTNRE